MINKIEVRIIQNTAGQTPDANMGGVVVRFKLTGRNPKEWLERINCEGNNNCSYREPFDDTCKASSSTQTVYCGFRPLKPEVVASRAQVLPARLRFTYLASHI